MTINSKLSKVLSKVRKNEQIKRWEIEEEETVMENEKKRSRREMKSKNERKRGK